MPVETGRLQRRIGPRDRRFLALLACAALVGTPSAVLLGGHGERSSVGARCVTTTGASIMGGATFTYCGASAVAFCRRSASGDERVAARCARLGLARRA